MIQIPKTYMRVEWCESGLLLQTSKQRITKQRIKPTNPKPNNEWKKRKLFMEYPEIIKLRVTNFHDISCKTMSCSIVSRPVFRLHFGAQSPSFSQRSIFWVEQQIQRTITSYCSIILDEQAFKLLQAFHLIQRVANWYYR